MSDFFLENFIWGIDTGLFAPSIVILSSLFSYIINPLVADLIERNRYI